MNRDRSHQLLYLSHADVQAIGPSMAEIISALESMFREKGEGRVEMPPKIGVHTLPDAFIHAMPAYIAAQKAVGMKWVSGYPENSKRGLPYIAGLLILNDAETGMPLAVMDCTWITAQRTGAATAVAAKYLARKESETVGILGCGVQGRSNLEALKVLFPLKKARAYDVHSERAEKYAQEMSSQLGIDAVSVATSREAVVDCDMVVTAGPILRKPHATIQRDGSRKEHLRRWWISIPTGIPMRFAKPINSVLTMCPSSSTIARSDISRTCRLFTPTWVNSSPDANPAGKRPQNVPSHAILALH